MIGFYNYTVWLTLASLVSAVVGMTQAMDGHFRLAVLCLAISGLCDAFDGRIARTKKDRTQDERCYGMHLDSLCDMVCFGFFPALICYLLGVRGIWGIAVCSLYCVCAVIRLSYFNVMETHRSETGEEKVYHGLPVTAIAVVLPLTFLLEFFMTERTFRMVLVGMLMIVSICFILNFRFPCPTTRTLILTIIIVAAAVAAILLFSRFRIVRPYHDAISGALIDRFLVDGR